MARITGKRQYVARAKQLMEDADLLLARLREGIGMVEPDNFSALKNAAAVMKDIKDIQMLRSDADEREQEAKIAGLLCKLAGHPEAGAVTVRLEEVPEEWGQ